MLSHYFADLSALPPIAPPDSTLVATSSFPYTTVILGLGIAAGVGFALWGVSKLRERMRERRRARRSGRERRVVRQFPLG